MKLTDITAEFIEEQNGYASDLYTAAQAQADEVERIFKSEFDIPTDTTDKENPGSPDVRKPARARAILEKFLSLLSLRSTQTIQVIPGNLTNDEIEACSKIERWLRGYQLAYMLETKRNPWRHAAYWYFLRGRGCLETRFDTSQLGRDRLAVRTYADDPYGIYSVWDRDGVCWYTKEYNRYAKSVKDEIARRRKGDKDQRWKGVELPDKVGEEVEIVEYWDDTYCAASCNGELLYRRQHDYGFVPLAEARCLETPLASQEWAFQSVLAPIMDSLKGMYALASKMATGVDLFYWPKILVESPSGQAVILDSGAPGVESNIPVGAKVTVISPTPNDRVLAQLMGWYQSDVQLGGIPDIAWGSEPHTLQSGFAVSQVLGQVMDKIAPHEQALELALGWDWSHKLQLIEKFGDVDGAYLSVPVEREYAQKTSDADPISIGY